MFRDYWPEVETNPASSPEEKQYSTWYNRVSKLVLSTLPVIPKDENTIIISADTVSAINHLKHQPGKDIYLFGSPAVGQFLQKNNLIDEYWIFINPVVFGSGIPMFAPDSSLMRLNFLETVTICKAEVALHYEIRK